MTWFPFNDRATHFKYAFMYKRFIICMSVLTIPIILTVTSLDIQMKEIESRESDAAWEEEKWVALENQFVLNRPVACQVVYFEL